MEAHVGDDQRAALGRLGQQPRADGEAQVGIVGADLDRGLAADAVRATDPADHEAQGLGPAGGVLLFGAHR